MATVPRGIQPVKHVNKDGSTTLKYRVRIVRKNIKEDKRFDDLQEAKEFLANSKSVKGREKIQYWSKTEAEFKQAQQETDKSDYSFGHFIDLYIHENVTKGMTMEEIKSLPELDHRNITNKLSFFKTIRNTSIIDKTITYQDYERWNLDPEVPIPRFFGAFDIRKIGIIQINDYVKERLKKGMAKPSVSREVTFISNVFRKIRFLSKELEDLKNPTRDFDKDLLVEKNKPKRKINLTPEEQVNLLKELGKKNNKEMSIIATISILTSLRRAEIITLRKGQIFHNYIQVIRGKNGTQREVHINETARSYLEKLELLPGTDKYFKYTIAGFSKMFYDFLKSQKLQGKFRFHDFRRIAITNKLLEFGAQNSLLATEFLGMTSERKLKELYIDTIVSAPKSQEDLLKMFGHATTETTQGYFSLPTNIDKK